jgi:hypothetical protein
MRLTLYILTLALTAFFDRDTPLGVADWIAEVSIVWVASVWGTTIETKAVAIASSIILMVGLWTSPDSYLPFWIGVLNRLMAVAMILGLAYLAASRQAARESASKAAAQVKILQGLLPICACCKAIRTPTEEWHQLEKYLSDNAEVSFTHTYCPRCAEKLMSEIAAAGNPPLIR